MSEVAASVHVHGPALPFLVKCLELAGLLSCSCVLIESHELRILVSSECPALRPICPPDSAEL